jgi:hypothetical protein
MFKLKNEASLAFTSKNSSKGFVWMVERYEICARRRFSQLSSTKEARLF